MDLRRKGVASYLIRVQDSKLFRWERFQHVGSTGGVCPEFNIWGGVGWGGDDTVPCNCTHLGATQLMFLALAHISMLRN